MNPSSRVLRPRPHPLALTIALALAGSPFAAAHAATVPVTSCADDGSPGTLRAAAASALDGDTVDMTQLTCSTITVLGGPIEMYQRGLTLQGPGRDRLTIDGGHATTILFFYGSSYDPLILRDLTLANGSAIETGRSACIDSFGGNLVLERTTISDCQKYSRDQSVESAAFWVNGLTMIDSAIIDSSARSRTAYAVAGGATAGGAVLIRSTISGNAAVGATAPAGACGGGLSVDNLMMVDSTISDNYCLASGDGQNATGGGLFIHGSATILRSAITGNRTDGDGGGLFKGDESNGARATFTIQDSTIANNSAGGSGGALYSEWPVTIANSTIADNYSALGGAVRLNLYGRDFYGNYYVRGWPDFESTIIAGNTSGPVPVYAADLTTVPALTVFGAHNLVGDADVGIVLPPDTLRGDPELQPLGDNGGPTPTLAPAPGSPVVDTGANALAFRHDQRGGNFARVYGSATDIGAYEVQPPPVPYRAGPVRTARSATRPGGTPAMLPVTSCADDDSPGTLRAVANEAYDGDTIDLTQLTCSTITLQQGPIDLSLLGPNPLHSLTIAGPGSDALTISGNDTSAVFLLGASDYGYNHPGTITLSNLTVAHGAKYDASACVSTLTDSTVLDGVTVTDCHTNWVGGSSALWRPGGGGAVSAWNLTLVDSTISDSSLTAVDRNVVAGGGAWAYYASLARSTISGNSLTAPVAYAHQGYQTAGGGLFTMRSATLTDSTISGNSAVATDPGEDANGGGIAGLWGGAELLRSTVSGNTADGIGGGVGCGLYFYGRQPLTHDPISIYDSTLTGNTARFGGAIGAAANMTLYNSTVAFNMSTDGGAVGFVSPAFAWYPSYGLLTHSTIIASNATGPAPSHAADLAKFSMPDVLVIGDHNLIGAADPAIELPPATLRDDPLLQPLAWNGGPTATLALAPGSPAIDTGSNPLDYATDQRGDGYLRVRGAAADIGAYEVQVVSDAIFADGFDP